MQGTLRFWAAVALVGATAVAVATASNPRVLSPDIGITLSDDGSALVQVPYRRDGPAGVVSIQVEGTEVVAGFPAQPRKYWNNNYLFSVPAVLPEDVRVDVVFTSPVDVQSVSAVVRPTRMRARADDIDDTPAVAAAAMVMLAKRNGADDKLPAPAATMLAELTSDLRQDFVAGLNLWATKKGLPIHTAKLGDARGRTTLAAVQAALERGDTAQIMLDNRMVNLVSVVDSFILIDDPRGPMGTTVLRLDDPRRVGWGFSQRWCGVVQCP